MGTDIDARMVEIAKENAQKKLELRAISPLSKCGCKICDRRRSMGSLSPIHRMVNAYPMMQELQNCTLKWGGL